MSMQQGSFYDMEVARSHALLDKAGDPLAKLDRRTLSSCFYIVILHS